MKYDRLAVFLLSLGVLFAHGFELGETTPWWMYLVRLVSLFLLIFGVGEYRDQKGPKFLSHIIILVRVVNRLSPVNV